MGKLMKFKFAVFYVLFYRGIYFLFYLAHQIITDFTAPYVDMDENRDEIVQNNRYDYFNNVVFGAAFGTIELLMLIFLLLVSKNALSALKWHILCYILLHESMFIFLGHLKAPPTFILFQVLFEHKDFSYILELFTEQYVMFSSYWISYMTFQYKFAAVEANKIMYNE